MKRNVVIFILTLTVSLLGMSGCSRRNEPKNTEGNDWTIYAGESSQEAAETLQASIAKTEVATARVVTERPDSWKGRLILVGDTGEEASKEAALTLGEQGFLVKFGSEQVVILGSTEEKTKEAVAYVCENYMSYLEEYCDLPFGKAFDYLSAENTGSTKQVLLNEVSIERYKIAASGGEKNAAAVFLRDVVKDMTGIELAVEDTADGAEYRIVFVSGGKEEAKGLKEQQFHFFQEGNTMYLCSGSEDQELLAAKMFAIKYLNYNYVTQSSSESMISIDGLDFKFTCNWDEFTAPLAVQSRILMIPAKNGYSVLQGGCTDGTYAYYIVNNQSGYPYVNIIYKVDLATMEIVKVSDKLELQHANSITYNSKIKQLMVVNYDPDKEVISYVDPETLTITKRGKVDFNALSLSYNEERDAYVAGTRGTFDFFLLDKNMKVTDYCESIQTKSVKQEVEVYKDRILFSMSGDNIVYVYDWSGKFLYAIDMGLYEEIENLIFYGDLAYTGYYSSGGIICQTIFYQEIK